MIFERFGFKKKSSQSPLFVSDDENFDSQNLAFKTSALDKCVNYVARTLSKSRILIKGKCQDKDRWLYWLNVRPNPNQSAPQFWMELIQNLMNNGEALIFTDKKYLFLAENFSQEKRLKGNTFHIASSQGQTVDKKFKADDVIYLTYDNDGLEKFSDQLWADYAALLGRVIINQKTANQLRFTINMSRDKIRERQQEMSDGASGEDARKVFLKRLTARFNKDPVVAIPVTQHSNYQEFHGNASVKTSYVDDIKKLRQQYVDDVAEMIGIPVGLLHGEVADNSKNYRQYIEVVIEPLVVSICKSLEHAIFEPTEYLAGGSVKITGLKNYDMFDISASADKLIADGIVNADEIREELGLPPIPDGKGQVYYMTKNYEELGEKGEKENDNH